MALRGLLFDKDGTLIHFDATWHPAVLKVLQQQAGGRADILKRLAAALDYDLAEQRFRPKAQFIAGAWPDYGPAWAEALGVANDAAFERATNTLLNQAALDCLAPVGDPLAVLKDLADQGLSLGIATNDVAFAAHEQARALGLDRILHFIAGCDSGHGAKPEPGMIHAFANQVGLDAHEIALIGDSLHDMETAQRAGSLAIAVLTGPATRAQLAGKADYIVNTIADIPALVRSINSAAG